MAFTETDDDAPILLVTNANPYKIFTGGSLLAIPWDEVDLSTSRNVITDTSAVALDMPDFAGGLAIADDLGMVGVRLSEDARTRVYDDPLYLVDLSDPMDPTLSNRGTDQGSTVVVESDPVDVVHDNTSGLAYVGNRTDHTISVIDTTGEILTVIAPWPEQVLTSATFSDVDESGSTGELSTLEESVDEETGDIFLDDDTWTLTWVEGIWRFWLPDPDGGLYRVSTTGDGSYTASSIGTVLNPEDVTEVTSVSDPWYQPGSPGRMYFSDSGTIRAAQTGAWLADWYFETNPLLEGDDGELLSGPSMVFSDNLYWLFFDSNIDGQWTIETAISEDGTNFQRERDISLAPQHEHESARISDPNLHWDADTNQWRLYYSSYDGTQWTIGHATSDDLTEWDSDPLPVFEVDGVDVASPMVDIEPGDFRMWYASGEDGLWSVGLATSVDGLNWADQGIVQDLNIEDLQNAPTFAMTASRTDAFHVDSAQYNTLLPMMEPGEAYNAVDYGWMGTALVGAWLSTDGDLAAGGVRIDSIGSISKQSLAWLTMQDGGGTTRIGVASFDNGLSSDFEAILDPGDDFDEDGVSSPVVWWTGSTWAMAYGAHKNDEVSIALATSDDGLLWTKQGLIFESDSDWNSLMTIPSSISQDDSGAWQLWYSGSNGDLWRIGVLTSDDGLNWTTNEDGNWLVEAGSAGEWDDSGVKDPFVLYDDGSLSGEVGEHMWYSGFNGSSWRVGYAWRADGDADWSRAEDPTTEEARAVIEMQNGLFHPDGIQRPVVAWNQDGISVWYAGFYENVSRVGMAVGQTPDRLSKVPRRPTVGDTLTFETERGDESVMSIPLDGSIDNATLSGIGLTSLTLDTDRGFLYACSKLRNYITVIDIRDDSTDDFTDLNYLDIEAILVVETASGATGFRQALPTDTALYALNDAPESVYILDIDLVEDSAYPVVVYDAQVGWLPTPPGVARDDGLETLSNIGPAQMILHESETLLVTNFNANSIGVYDLNTGPYGQMTTEVGLVGENPYSIVISPDGKYAVFANYSGEVTPEGLAQSTLGVLDIDPDSPTYLQVVTWIANQ